MLINCFFFPQYHFNDNHYVAEVHWAGSNSSVILMLMRDPTPVPTRPSYFYVSRDYGRSFQNITSKFMLNGTLAVINDYYPSPVNNQHYIITAKFHKYIFVSTDACASFRAHSVPFVPTKIKFHPDQWRYLLAYDEDHPMNKVISTVSTLCINRPILQLNSVPGKRCDPLYSKRSTPYHYTIHKQSYLRRC